MASAPQPDDTGSLFENFLARRGHEPADRWDWDSRKKQCPECGGLHDLSAHDCSVCGWSPTV